MKPVAGWGGLPASRSAVVHGAHEPAYELDPGRPEHPRLCHGPIGPGARLLEFPRGTPHAGSSMEEGAMEVLYPRCAGLDVHKDTVVASARLATGRDVTVEVRTFPTRRPGCSRSRPGWPSAAARTSPWRRPASTGSRSGTSWPTATSPWRWRTPRM